MLRIRLEIKSFRAKDGSDKPPDAGRNGERDFKQEKLANETHASTTDPDARLHRKAKGQESKLANPGHALMENRNGLAADGRVTTATGTAEREAADDMTQDLPAGATLGADKGCDAEAFVEGLAERGIVPHIAVDGSVTKTGKTRKMAVPPEVAASDGYAVSMRIRKRIEEILRWAKITGGLAQSKLRGLARVGAVFVFGLAACNLVRLPKLPARTAELCPDGGK